MDISVHTQNECIRKIEDIIDIQKANGNFNSHQVVFNFSSDMDSSISRNPAKSLESGLFLTKPDNVIKKQLIKFRQNRHKSPLPDVVSWPSDSDITVLRMNLCITNSDLKERVGSLIPGDGLHQRDSSSMINLATLIRQSQPPSKQSFNYDDYLLPLTSWEHDRDPETEKEAKVEEAEAVDISSKFYDNDYGFCKAICSNVPYSSKDSNTEYSKLGTVSKLARFLRLYFCPCCTCLYKLEKMQDVSSIYFANQNLAVPNEVL